MVSVKVKFRSSKKEGGEGVIYYQIIQNRVVRQINTNYRIYPSEWDSCDCRVVTSQFNSSRDSKLLHIQAQIKLDLSRLEQIIAQLSRVAHNFSSEDIVTSYNRHLEGKTLLSFGDEVISQLRELRKMRCVETYKTTLKSFMRFTQREDVLLTDISSELMLRYEAYLKHEGISMNTISFYMRILRAIYNRAIENDLIVQRHPFKKVYTGVDKTTKRALPLKHIKLIKELDLSRHPKMAYARDMFLLSFYTRGMSFVDMSFLRKCDLNNGYIAYRRRKTGQQLNIKWEKCMQEIVSRYNCNSTKYLFPIITKDVIDERRYYQNELAKINMQLKRISDLLSLEIPLTMYVARHSWASIAKSKNIPLSVISEGMGHDSESTTLIYLASLDTAIVDNANRAILRLLG